LLPRWRDLRDRPLEKRKPKLAWLLRRCDGIRLVEHMKEDGAPVFEHACRLGFEGIVTAVRVMVPVPPVPHVHQGPEPKQPGNSPH
jgi:hypothetical protein